MIPSPQNVRTYDLKPEMSARQVCQVVTKAIDAGKYDLVVVNFANPDMVGHTGVIEAAVEAVEVVDECLGKIVSTLENKSGKAIITADHGNCDQMLNYNDGSPHTAHTTHPVPLIVYGDRTVADLSNDGALCDVAPTLLELMQIAKPDEMTGRSLLVHNQACLVNQNRQLAE